MLALTWDTDDNVNLDMVIGIALGADGELAVADAEGNMRSLGQADGDQLILFGRSSERLSIVSPAGVALYDEEEDEAHRRSPRLTLSASNGLLLLHDDEERLVAGVGNDGCWWLLGEEGRRLRGQLTLLQFAQTDPTVPVGPRGRLSELAQRR